VFNESAWTIYRAGVKALCLSPGETESAADETAATEPNAIEIAETHRVRLIVFPVPGAELTPSGDVFDRNCCRATLVVHSQTLGPVVTQFE